MLWHWRIARLLSGGPTSANCFLAFGILSRTSRRTRQVHRVLANNTALRQQLRDAMEAASLLTEKLEAARDNNRFLDKRIADLEAEIDDRRRQDRFKT
jgi:hypothetical protein